MDVQEVTVIECDGVDLVLYSPIWVLLYDDFQFFYEVWRGVWGGMCFTRVMSVEDYF